MALSISDQRRLADIEHHLCVEDPHLARLLASGSAGPSRRPAVGVVVGSTTSLAAMIAGGVLAGGAVRAVLIALGVLGLLGVLVVAAVGVHRRRPRRAKAARTDAGRPYGRPPWPGMEAAYIWWCWW